MRRVRRSARPRGSRATGLLSFLGCALSLHTVPAAAQVPSAVPPSRGERLAPPPWSGVSAHPPLALTRARVTPPPVRHPAVHPRWAGQIQPGPLFPRADEALRQKQERDAAMQRHPAGKGRTDRSAAKGAPALGFSAPSPAARSPKKDAAKAPVPEAACGSRKLMVRHGDSLWSLATSILGSAAEARVAHLTEQLFVTNRRVVGADPDLIHPGQKLSVPKDCRQ